MKAFRISDTIRAADGESPLQDRYCATPTKRATDIMRGRTYYYDPDTLRYFGASVRRLRVLADGLALVTLERSNMDMRGTRKGYRVTIHDFTGFCIDRGEKYGLPERPDPDKMTTSKAKADREFSETCALVEAHAADILRDAFARERARLERQLTATKQAQRMLPRERKQ